MSSSPSSFHYSSSSCSLRVRLRFDASAFAAFPAPRLLLFPVPPHCTRISDFIDAVQRSFSSFVEQWPTELLYSCAGAALFPPLPASVLRDGDVVTLTVPSEATNALQSHTSRKRGSRGKRRRIATESEPPAPPPVPVVASAPPASSAEPTTVLPASTAGAEDAADLQLGRGRYRFTEDGRCEPLPSAPLFVQPSLSKYVIKKRRKQVTFQLAAARNEEPTLSPPPPALAPASSSPFATADIDEQQEPTWMAEAEEARQRVAATIDEFGAFHVAPRTRRAVGLIPAVTGSDSQSARTATSTEDEAAASAGHPPLAEGLRPSVGDVLLYRVMQLSDAWTPELSPFHTARVTGVDDVAQRISLQPTLYIDAVRKAIRAGTAASRTAAEEEEWLACAELLDVRVLEGPSYGASLRSWREQRRRESKEAKLREKHRRRAEEVAQNGEMEAASPASSASSASASSFSTAPSPSEPAASITAALSAPAPRVWLGVRAAMELLRQRASVDGIANTQASTPSKTAVSEQELDALERRKAELLRALSTSIPA